MAKPHIAIGGFQMGSSTSAAESLETPDETPFRIVLMADFSGRAARGLSEPGLPGRKPLRVDRDNFDDVMSKVGIELPLRLFGLEGNLRFRELDDFLPDRLYMRLDVFQKLRATRDELQNPATFAAAAADVRRWAEVPTGTRPEASPAESSPATNLSPEELLAQMLGEPALRSGVPAAPVASSSPALGGFDFNELLRKIAAPHVVTGADPRQSELVAAVDEAIAGHMRSLLHHPVFQALEGAWRAAFFVVRKLDTDSQLQVHLLDVSKTELAADMDAADNLSDSGIYRILAEQTVGTPGALPWAVVAGHYTFEQTKSDVEFLGRLAQIAAKAGSPFLAGASPHVVGCESFAAMPDPRNWDFAAAPEGAAAWEILRQLPVASSIGLVLPRFALRLPYGKDGMPIEKFEFEELSENPKHEHFLWGNPAFVAVYLLGEAYSRQGWRLKPGVVRDVGGLPMSIFLDDGEKAIKPCAEALLTDRANSAILNHGLMPLLSIKDADAVSLASFQSIADPGQPLKARWPGA